MKCIECGHELKDGAIFCIRCGAMQVSMDGKPLERGEDWPKVDASADSAGYRSSTAGALHSAQSKNPRGFNQPPKRNGGKIAAIIIAIVALIAIVAFAVTQFVMPATSGSTSGSATTTTSSSAATSSTSAASSTASASVSAASASASAASASASAASASAAAATTDGTATQQAQPQPQAQPAPEPAPEPEPVYYNDYYVLPDSSSYYYSYGELSGMSTYDLYLARNEIYARHGRMFNRADLQDYFNSQAWYEPIYAPSQFNDMAMLSDVELQNAKLMKQVEADKGSPYL